MYAPCAKQSYSTNSLYPSSEVKSDLSVNLRVNFIRKVFGIVAVQLMITSIFIGFSALSTSYVRFQQATPYLSWLILAVALGTMLTLLASDSLSRTFPNNYYLLGLFTLCESYLVSAITANYEPWAVFEAMLLTAGVVAALALYAFVSKREITYFRGLIWMLMLSGLGMAIISFFIKTEYRNFFLILLSIVLAGEYLIYDVKAIMGNNATFKVDIDDYVRGALMIYVDIIRIFIRILVESAIRKK